MPKKPISYSQDPKPVVYEPTMILKWFPTPKGCKYGQWELRQRFDARDGTQSEWRRVEQATTEEIESLKEKP